MKRIEMESFNVMFRKMMHLKEACSSTNSLPYVNSSELYLNDLTCAIDDALACAKLMVGLYYA